MLIAFYDCYKILNKVYSDGAYLKQAMADTQIDPKNRAYTTKVCYGVLDNDIALEYFISCLCEKRPKQAIRIILKISMYAIKYLAAQPYAVVDNSVELTKKLGKAGASAFVNAFLRKFVSFDFTYPDGAEGLSVRYSYPEFLVKSLISDYGRDVAEKIMGASGEITTVRFASDVRGDEYLSAKGFDFIRLPFENAFIVDGFRRNDDFDKGIYTFQSVGSIAICDVVECGENLLDACAAPGGKSVLLSEKFKAVTSCDIHPHRVALIREYASRMRRENVQAVVCDSAVENPEFSGRFDAVLCDVPCSGSGVIKDNPDIKLRRKQSDVESLNLTQYKILDNCSKNVSEGGRLYYSTCSVLDCENDEIIDKFLKNHNDFKVMSVSSPIAAVNKKYGVQFLPHLSYGAGFYVCKMEKIR